MCMMLILKMCYCIVKMSKHGINSSSMMGLCFELTSYAFQLVPFTYCCYRRHMEVADETLWCQEDEDILAAHFFWSKMRRDMVHFVARCTTYQKAKSRLNPHGLYMSLPAPSVP
jgi:hypothetical protein